MISRIPALDQTFTSKCHESKGFTINNGPEETNKGSNSKKKYKYNKVKHDKINITPGKGNRVGVVVIQAQRIFILRTRSIHHILPKSRTLIMNTIGFLQKQQLKRISRN